MNKKLKAFSLAELLISLLIISIVLSAAIPTLTKKNAGAEMIWRWSNTNNSAYFGAGALQTAMLGTDVIPDVNVANNFTPSGVEGIENLDTSNIKFTNSGDKLIILKQSTSDNADSNLANSHISFFTLKNKTDATSNDIIYTGRLVLERHNIGLGIGTLQWMNNTTDDFLGKNTAIGHYSLMKNTSGEFNTALGENSLSNNIFGSHNTAIGYQAGLNIDNGSTDENSSADNNTIIGSQALKTAKKSTGATAVGYMALSATNNSVNNTAVGALALKSSYGNGNIALGASACRDKTTERYNICIGNEAGNFKNESDTSDDTSINTFRTNYSITSASNEKHNILYIGSMPASISEASGATNSTAVLSRTPLIFGRMQHVSTNLPRIFALNTKLFDINTFDGNLNLFRIAAIAGANGVTNGGNFYGKMTLKAYKNGSDVANLNILSDNKNAVYIESSERDCSDSTCDLSAINKISSHKNIIFNNGKLKLNFNIADTEAAEEGGTPTSNFSMTSDADNISLFDNRIVINPSTKTPGLLFDTSGNITLKNTSNGAYIGVNDDNSLAIRSSHMNVDSTKIEFDLPFTAKRAATFGVSISLTGLSTTQAPSDDLKTTIIDIYKEIAEAKEAAYNSAFIPDSGYKLAFASDERLKNILGDNTAGLKEINKLEIKDYTYKKDKNKSLHVGVIAQQLQNVFPNSVFEGKDGYLKIKLEEIFWAMVNSIKELSIQLQDLTAKITGLDKRLEALEKENAALKKQNNDFEKRLKKLEKKL